jgi:death on curing protein
VFVIHDLVHLTAVEITDIHDLIIDQDGGLRGSRPDLSVDALIGRIHANLAYQRFESIAEVAALYAEVIAKGHVFLDGNKRTALLSMLGFLDENGYSTSADPVGLAEMIVRLVGDELNYRQFAVWLEPKLLIAPDEQ